MEDAEFIALFTVNDLIPEEWCVSLRAGVLLTSASSLIQTSQVDSSPSSILAHYRIKNFTSEGTLGKLF
jgi:hypothetical protein